MSLDNLIGKIILGCKVNLYSDEIILTTTDGNILLHVPGMGLSFHDIKFPPLTDGKVSDLEIRLQSPYNNYNSYRVSLSLVFKENKWFIIWVSKDGLRMPKLTYLP